MLGAREDADESAERRLEASLRPKRLAARYGWRLPDDQLQFRDEGSDELAVGAESFFDGATPGRNLGFALSQERADNPLESLR